MLLWRKQGARLIREEGSQMKHGTVNEVF